MNKKTIKHEVLIEKEGQRIPLRKAISANLITQRKKHGLNQTQAGAIVGVNKTTYATWEQNRSMPTVDTLYALAQHYGVSMDKMYGLEDVKIEIRPEGEPKKVVAHKVVKIPKRGKIKQ